ncbi:transposase domain-containing protein [Solwaraspora sp. WMMA2056]|uniref:transposase domain-containing protein n=1 Tax=Solwaraspora sp. WMMA2056 TaxID=3015161 RepID=UPI00259BE26F|nr:transposase domain-containing protein [Solwaraspora sp. WMMA2056]WJK43806.1 transposase domain-containing protein [Solwaraspora sp. WMMA2056]
MRLPFLGRVRVAAGVFAPGHLGELTQFLPFEMVDEVLAATRRTQQRIRLLRCPEDSGQGANKVTL